MSGGMTVRSWRVEVPLRLGDDGRWINDERRGMKDEYTPATPLRNVGKSIEDASIRSSNALASSIAFASSRALVSSFDSFFGSFGLRAGFRIQLLLLLLLLLLLMSWPSGVLISMGGDVGAPFVQ